MREAMNQESRKAGKFLLVFVPVFLLSLASFSGSFDVSKVDTSTISVAEIEATLEHKERLFDELLSILKDKNPVVIDQLRASLKSANDATLEAAKHAAELQRQKDEAVAARDHLLAKLHQAKIIFSVLVAAAIAFVVIRSPSTFTIYGGIAIGAVLIGGIWAWL